MAHDILEDRYVGTEIPWHRIGTILNQKAFTAADAIEYAKLDYGVEKMPLYTRDGQQVESMATIRADLPNGHPDRILGIVGPRYTVVQNVDAFSFFDNVVGSDQAIYESVGVLAKGAEIFIVAKIPKEFWVASDKFEEYVTLTNSHNGMRALRIFVTPVRVVCRNTLNFALRNISAGVVLKHTQNVHQRMLDSAEILGLADERFREIQALFEHLATQPVTHPLFQEYVETLFPTTGERPNQRTLDHRQGVAMLFDSETNTTPGVAHSWYSAAQSVVEYVDHAMAYTKKDAAEEALFGRGAKIKSTAINLATNLAIRYADG